MLQTLYVVEKEDKVTQSLFWCFLGFGRNTAASTAPSAEGVPSV